MSTNIPKLHWIWKICSYFDVNNNNWLNQQNNEWEWLFMKVSSTKLCHESNHTKIALNQKTTDLVLPSPTIFDWINEKWNYSHAVWRQVHQKYVLSPIIQKIALNHKHISSITLMLPTMFNLIDKTMNDSDSVWWWVHKKYAMIPIIQKLYSIKKTDFTLLLPIMFDWINKTRN